MNQRQRKRKRERARQHSRQDRNRYRRDVVKAISDAARYRERRAA